MYKKKPNYYLLVWLTRFFRVLYPPLLCQDPGTRFCPVDSTTSRFVTLISTQIFFVTYFLPYFQIPIDTNISYFQNLKKSLILLATSHIFLISRTFNSYYWGISIILIIKISIHLFPEGFAFISCKYLRFICFLENLRTKEYLNSSFQPISINLTIH